MIKLRLLSIALLACIVFAVAAKAQRTTPCSDSACLGEVFSGGVSAPAPSYVGPLDSSVGIGTANAYAWWGLFAPTAASIGSRVVNVCNSTGGVDVGCADMVTGTNGQIVSATISGITCPGANCTIKIFYDTSGNSNCSGACDASQATIANRATLTTGCANLPGTMPCASISSGSNTGYTTATGSGTLFQNVSIASATSAAVVGACGCTAVFITGSNTGLNYANGIGLALKLGGSQAYQATSSNNTYYAAIGANDNVGNTSSLTINGSTSSGANSTAVGNGPFNFMSDQFNQTLIGSAIEGGIFPITFNSTQISNLNANMRSRGGY